MFQSDKSDISGVFEVIRAFFQPDMDGVDRSGCEAAGDHPRAAAGLRPSRGGLVCRRARCWMLVAGMLDQRREWWRRLSWWFLVGGWGVKCVISGISRRFQSSGMTNDEGKMTKE